MGITIPNWLSYFFRGVGIPPTSHCWCFHPWRWVKNQVLKASAPPWTISWSPPRLRSGGDSWLGGYKIPDGLYGSYWCINVETTNKTYEKKWQTYEISRVIYLNNQQSKHICNDLTSRRHCNDGECIGEIIPTMSSVQPFQLNHFISKLGLLKNTLLCVISIIIFNITTTLPMRIYNDIDFWHRSEHFSPHIFWHVGWH